MRPAQIQTIQQRLSQHPSAVLTFEFTTADDELD